MVKAYTISSKLGSRLNILELRKLGSRLNIQQLLDRFDSFSQRAVPNEPPLKALDRHTHCRVVRSAQSGSQLGQTQPAGPASQIQCQLPRPMAVPIPERFPFLSAQPFDCRQHLFPAPPPLQCPALRLFPMPPPIHPTDPHQILPSLEFRRLLHIPPRTGLHSFPDRLLHILLIPPLSLRSEERRVGKECRSRWVPYYRNIVKTRVGSIRTPEIIAQSIYPFLHMPPIREPTRAQAICC